ncbi:MAG: hypothetical protein ACRD36_08185 [Candidatus Acidiferrum sp.]
MKFIVKIIQASDIGGVDMAEFTVTAPSHLHAIQTAIENIGDAASLTPELRSLAYVAEKIDRHPDDEPEEIFFIRKTVTAPWYVIDGDEERQATAEEEKALAEANAIAGCYGMKNGKIENRETRGARRRREDN